MIQLFVLLLLLQIYAVFGVGLEPAKQVLEAEAFSTPVIAPNGSYGITIGTQYSLANDNRTYTLYSIQLQGDARGKLTKLTNLTQPSGLVWVGDDKIGYVTSGQGPMEHWTINTYDLVSNKIETIQEFNCTISDLRAQTLQDGGYRLVFSAKFDGVKMVNSSTESVLAYDSLFVRHWDQWITNATNSLFSLHVWANRSVGNVEHILLDHRLQSPVAPFGDRDDFSLGSNGQVAFLAKDPALDPANNTASHIYLISSSYDLTQINQGPGASANPVFSPNGNLLAYLEMRVPCYEADRNRLVVYNITSGGYTYLTEEWDRSPSRIVWSRDGSTIYVIAEDWGRRKLFELHYNGTWSGPSLVLSDDLYYSVNTVEPAGKSDLLIVASSWQSPMMLYLMSIDDGTIEEIRSQTLDSGISSTTTESFTFQGAKTTVHGFIVKPPNFDSSRKYPLAFLIHGGPQGSWSTTWNTRWNPSVFATSGQGYVVVMINPTGSTSYGQAFTDAIQNNWGSLPYEDLEKGLDYVLSAYPYLDADKAVALGASYGGYMINWINGHPLGKRFKALICHDGVFNTFNTFYTTEELYFPHHDFGGYPFSSKEAYNTYAKYNPSEFVNNWSTPTLIIHGDLDYRLTIGEGLAAFNTLQMLGVPSRLLVFKEENHWVLQPKNAYRWSEEVVAWMDRWTGGPQSLKIQN